MKILVACEESQRVTVAFREKGHIAFSCDLQDCSGEHPEWHIKGNALPLLNGCCRFTTSDGINHILNGKWDMIIVHPPCTYFSNATMVNLGRKDKPDIFNEEWRKAFYKKRQAAFEFVMSIYNADCEKICIENVVGYLSTHFKKPTQIIQPYYFGEPWRKATCLWLKGLPPLVSTDLVEPQGKWVKHNLKSKDDLKGYAKRGVFSAKERSRTFLGVANAMANQWG